MRRVGSWLADLIGAVLSIAIPLALIRAAWF